MPQIYCHPVVKKVVALHAELLSVYPGEFRVIDVLERQAQTLLKGFKEGDDAVAFQLSNWLPECIGMPAHEIMEQGLTIHHMRLAVAREHGYVSWEAAMEDGHEVLNADFELAVDAVLNGNMKKLQELIEAHPDFITRRSQYGHRASLLVYLAANGVETWRQVVPENAADVMAYLIKAGAECDVKIDVYGGKHSTLELLLSSAHPRKAGVLDGMVEVLSS